MITKLYLYVHIFPGQSKGNHWNKLATDVLASKQKYAITEMENKLTDKRELQVI